MNKYIVYMVALSSLTVLLNSSAWAKSVTISCDFDRSNTAVNAFIVDSKRSTLEVDSGVVVGQIQFMTKSAPTFPGGGSDWLTIPVTGLVETKKAGLLYENPVDVMDLTGAIIDPPIHAKLHIELDRSAKMASTIEFNSGVKFRSTCTYKSAE